MSDNVIISVGGRNRNFSGVNKLGTVLQSGGESLWFNKREQEVDHITGRDTDGNDKDIKRGPNGNIIKSILPSEIQIVTPPNKTTYPDGAIIDYTGMVVKAYDASGDIWINQKYPNGIIPHDELILPETINASELISVDYGCKYKVYGGPIISPDASPEYEMYYIKCLTSIGKISFYDEFWTYEIENYGGAMTSASRRVYIASESPHAKLIVTRHYTYGRTQTYEYILGNQHDFSYNNKTVYYMGHFPTTSGSMSINIPRTNSDFFTESRIPYTMWYMIFGTKIPQQPYIDVSWMRPSDNKTLTDSFAVTIMNAT